MATQVRWVVGLLLAISAFLQTATALADEPERKTTYVRGTIDHDETWSGRIVISEPVHIEKGTLTIEAGTIIELGCFSGENDPALEVRSKNKDAWIAFRGTEQNPIRVRGQEGTDHGSLHVAIYPPIRRNGDEGAVEATPSDRAYRWEYLRFEALTPRYTYPRNGHHLAGTSRFHTALKITVDEDISRFSIQHCAFERTTSCEIHLRGGGELEIGDCYFRTAGEHVRVPRALQVSGNPKIKGTTRIVNNIIEGELTISRTGSMIERNAMIGQFVGIVIGGADTIIRDNYIHSKRHSYAFPTCIKCDQDDVTIEGNVIRSIPPCIEQGPLRIRDNVLIADSLGPPRKQGPEEIRRGRLIDIVAPGAIIERNLLIGVKDFSPAPLMRIGGSLIFPKPPPVIVRNNFFDGLDGNSRGIILASRGLPGSPCEVYNNVFIRLASTIEDPRERTEMLFRDVLLYSDFNALSALMDKNSQPPTVIDRIRGSEGWAKNDLSLQEMARLRLTGPLLVDIPDYDAEIQSGKLSVAALRENLFEMYRPRSDSPLVGAGRPDPDNPSGPRPSIGCCEPKPR